VSGRSRVHVIALGGTIAMTAQSDEGVRPTLSAGDLLGAVGDAPNVDITAESLTTVPGAYLTVDDTLQVCARAMEELAHGAAGVVVVQGTDTLEETAFVADLVHAGREPIVFTGAMRHPASLGADGPANLRDAIVAASTLENCGTLVCMGTELHAARFVVKGHAFAPAAFVSPSCGPVGWVVENQATLHTMVTAVPRFALAELGEGPHPYVPIYRMSLGDDAAGLEALAASSPAGLVLEGLGAGHVNPAVADAAAMLATSVPVVLASRTGGGSVLTSTYGFEGSERDLLRRGLLSAGRLTGVKARLLLGLSLRVDDAAARRRRFAAWSA
jgi:L-asparaginase